MRRPSLCVAVCSATAERARRVLSELGVLSDVLKVERADVDVFPSLPSLCRVLVLFPITRPLLKPELERLRRSSSFLHVCLYSFPVRERQPKISELLEKAVPENFLTYIPHSLDIIGDIAIVELNPEIWEFRGAIGDAILKSNRHVKAVFAKGGRVNGVYRVRSLVHIAGEARTVTFHKENGCIFKVDVANTYFSPRLSGERVRIASQVNPGEVVVDLFAGVGPFSILIAKMRRGIVHAIDINPFAIQLLEENIKLNKVSDLVHPYLGDCREVVNAKLKRVADHVIMNLPGSAYKFIDVACLALKENGGVIHYYQFGKEQDTCNSVVEFFERQLSEVGASLVKVLNVRRVRSTAPREWQIAVDAVVRP